MSIQDTHEEKLTLTVDVLIPGHDERTTTELFRKSRAQLLKRSPACWICGAKKGLEAHHLLERSMANMMNLDLIVRDAQAGELGITQAQRDACKAFNWESIEKDPMRFFDDMMMNGWVLCKAHHIGKDEGIHAMPFPLFLAQRYGKEGYKFSDVEFIHHECDSP